MTGIQHLPMGLMWNMPIPVACSLATVSRDLATSCGQCPLDGEGRVLAPGDAAAQAGLVAGMMQGVLSHLPAIHHAAVLVVYTDAPDTEAVLAPLAAAFPEAELVPVRLPHFYYPGMRIEVDLYATSTPPRRLVQTDGPARLVRVTGGPLEFVILAAPDMASALPLLQGVDADRLLSAQWFAPEPPPANLMPAPDARVVPPPGTGVAALLTLAPEPVQAETTPGGAILRRSGAFAWVAAEGISPDLARAAHQAMDALSLPDIPGLSPLKATTHYVGGPNPHDLHANLAVRHARFPMPGPASTGVAVAGLAAATLAIDMLAVIDSPTVSA